MDYACPAILRVSVRVGSHFDLQNGSICPEHKVEIITQSQVAHDRTREVLSRATTKD